MFTDLFGEKEETYSDTIKAFTTVIDKLSNRKTKLIDRVKENENAIKDIEKNIKDDNDEMSLVDETLGNLKKMVPQSTIK